MLKIAKLAQFYRLVVEEVTPAPHVFSEEAEYYVCIWKSPSFTFGEICLTPIDVEYGMMWDWILVFEWLTLQTIVLLIGIVIGAFLEQMWHRRKTTIAALVRKL